LIRREYIDIEKHDRERIKTRHFKLI